MRLVSFSVSNYRSITDARKIPLSDYSVLIGANNEGKSNVLHALSLAMTAIVSFKSMVRRTTSGSLVRVPSTILARRTGYDWNIDFPTSKRSQKGAHPTKIILEFQLTQSEIAEFKEEIRSNLNGTLPISVTFTDREFDISIAKQGPGGKSLTKKVTRIADFISQRIAFEYIPSIRTANAASRVISDLLANELVALEEDEEYQAAIQKIEDLQKPLLESLAETIQETVSSFLPKVQRVTLSVERESRYRSLRRDVKISVDDGSETPLERKGDGVQSLVALALMRHSSEQEESKRTTIVAIEEPESHLHPKAIHELRDVIRSLSDKNQVVLTSHSPLFVNPSDMSSTILVKGTKVTCAPSISSVRDELGVRLSDNLQSARLVALVEGHEDEISLRRILKDEYPEIAGFLANGDLVFDSLGGASNLAYKIRLYRSSACLVQCFLDSDASGQKAIDTALNEGVISVKDYNAIVAPGLIESELEDLFDPSSYRELFLNEFGVDPTINCPIDKNKKWTVSMAAKFKQSGKIWSYQTETQAKLKLAKHVEKEGSNVLMAARRAPLDAFANEIVSKLT